MKMFYVLIFLVLVSCSSSSGPSSDSSDPGSGSGGGAGGGGGSQPPSVVNGSLSSGDNVLVISERSGEILSVSLQQIWQGLSQSQMSSVRSSLTDTSFQARTRRMASFSRYPVEFFGFGLLSGSSATLYEFIQFRSMKDTLNEYSRSRFYSWSGQLHRLEEQVNTTFMDRNRLRLSSTESESRTGIQWNTNTSIPVNVPVSQVSLQSDSVFLELFRLNRDDFQVSLVYYPRVGTEATEYFKRLFGPALSQVRARIRVFTFPLFRISRNVNNVNVDLTQPEIISFNPALLSQQGRLWARNNYGFSQDSLQLFRQRIQNIQNLSSQILNQEQNTQPGIGRFIGLAFVFQTSESIMQSYDTETKILLQALRVGSVNQVQSNNRSQWARFDQRFTKSDSDPLQRMGTSFQWFPGLGSSRFISW